MAIALNAFWIKKNCQWLIASGGSNQNAFTFENTEDHFVCRI
jgi:hypothetical protein